MMNKILEKEKKLVITKNEDLFIHDSSVHFLIQEDAQVNIYHLMMDSDATIVIDLIGKNSSVDYYFSTINYDNHEIKITVNHLESFTTSNIHQHGVNVLNNKLHFLINGVIPKDKNGCICNQENQILNLQEGKSTICPNLLIDCYDVSSSHSAYIGKFSSDKLFYLMSRGLSEDLAYQLLMKGFLIPSSLDKNAEEVQDYLRQIEKL